MPSFVMRGKMKEEKNHHLVTFGIREIHAEMSLCASILHVHKVKTVRVNIGYNVVRSDWPAVT